MRIDILLVLAILLLNSCAEINLKNRNVDEFGISISCEDEVYEEITRLKEIKEIKCINENSTYIFRVTKYKNNLYHSDSIKHIDFDLDYSKRYFANSGKVELIGLLLKTVKGYPGKEYRFKYKFEDKINFRRVYIVKENVVEIIYEAKGSKIYSYDIGEYFDSFRIEGYDSNPIPYIDMPTDKEIKNRPYVAFFPIDTRQEVGANETDFGKVALVIEVCELKNKFNDGVFALSVLYGDFPTDLTPENKREILLSHKKTQEVTFPNFTWVDNNPIISDSLNLKFEYSIGEERVVDKRHVFF